MLRTPFAGVCVCMVVEGGQEKGRCGDCTSLFSIPGVPKAWYESGATVCCPCRSRRPARNHPQGWRALSSHKR